MDFVLRYNEMLDQLDQTMDSVYREMIFRYRFLDPHDLVGSEDVFSSEDEMIRHLATLIWIDHVEGDPVNRN
jgi:hypothetical protein